MKLRTPVLIAILGIHIVLISVAFAFGHWVVGLVFLFLFCCYPSTDLLTQHPEDRT